MHMGFLIALRTGKTSTPSGQASWPQRFANELVHIYAADAQQVRPHGDLWQVFASSDDARVHNDEPALCQPGDIATVTIDPRRATAVAQRDFAGVIPMYYKAVTDALVISTSILAIKRYAGDASWQLDPIFIGGFINSTYVHHSHTPDASVRRVLPGHKLTWAPRHAIATERYWFPPPTARTDPVLAYRHALERSVLRAVRRTDGLIALDLSGGHDSSAVAAVASHLVDRQRLVAITIWGGHVRADERVRAHVAAQHLGLRQIDIEWSDQHPPLFSDVDNLPELDEPNVLTAQWASLQSLDRSVRSATGATLRLSGLGGNELFAGETAPLIERLRRLHFLEAYLRSIPVAAQIGMSSIPFYGHLLAAAFPTLQGPPVGLRVLGRAWSRRWTWATRRWRCIGSRCEGEFTSPPPLQEVYGDLIATPNVAVDLGSMERIAGTLPTHHPLVDAEVFAVAVGATRPLRLQKQLHRAAVADLLPQEILSRSPGASGGQFVERGFRENARNLSSFFGPDARCVRLQIADVTKLTPMIMQARLGSIRSLGALMSAVALEAWLRAIERRWTLKWG